MSGSTFSITGIETGKPVYIQVRPYAGTASVHTDEGPWTTLTARTVPAAPSNYYVDQYLSWDSFGRYYYTHDGTWTPAPYASGYELYKSTNLGKTFSRAMVLNGGNYVGFYIYMRVVTYDQLYAKMGYLYKVRSYVTYKGVKYYGPFSPIVVSGDVDNTLYSDWNSTTSVMGSQLDRFETLMAEQRKGLSFGRARKITGQIKNQPKSE